jgi:hypothetical protein
MAGGLMQLFPQNQPEESPRTPRPYWIPKGVDYDALPEDLRLALEEIVNPAYTEEVLEATTPVEKAYGSVDVYLLWLLVLQQVELAKKMSPLVGQGESTTIHQEAIERHLRLVGSKINVGKLLLRLHEKLNQPDQSLLDRIHNRKGDP